MRRLRALAGTDQLRLLATALLLFFLIDFLRLAVVDPTPIRERPLLVVMDALAYVALIATIWRPRLGLGLAAIPLVTALVMPSTSMDALLLVAAPALGIVQLNRRTATAATAAVVAYVAARVAVYSGEGRLLVLATLGTAAVVGLTIGWVFHVLRRRREASENASLALATENLRIRADERRTLSRELHDVVAHQLSTASLQMMGARGHDDPALLRRVLATVDHATNEALTELRLLVRVLRDDPSTSASGAEIRELAERVPPTQAAAGAELALLEHGFEPDVSVPASADSLAMTVQRTLSRVITEATANIVAHAPERCRATIRVQVNEQQASVHVSNPIPDEATGAPLGWGLRGLRERAALTGGSFEAGAADGVWTVSVVLPLE